MTLVHAISSTDDSDYNALADVSVMVSITDVTPHVIPDGSPVGPRVYTVSFPRGTFSSVTVPFCDPEGQDLSYTVTQADGSPLPNWLIWSDVFDPPYFLSHAPDFDATAEDVQVKVTATNPAGGEATVTFTIEVVDPADPVAVAFARPNCDAPMSGN